MNDLISRQAAIDAVHAEFDECLVWDESGERTANEVEDILYRVPSAEPEISRIEQELHGKTPEEQYDFIYWLLFKSALNYSNSRLAIIEWLKGEKEDG